MRQPDGRWSFRLTRKPSALDLDELRRFAGVAFDPTSTVELRSCLANPPPGKKPPPAWSRVLRGDDIDGIVGAAVHLDDGGTRHVYYTLNPLGLPAGGTRAANDDDVTRRRWLLIDADPARAEGHKKDAATDAEKAAAWLVATRCRDLLDGVGWPAPAVVDSGNGWHLLYRVDLPNDGDSEGRVRRLLKGLSARLGAAEAGVDTTVYNASRIAKLPGTWARKGGGTPERPHRRARLMSAPDCPLAVTAGQLDAALALFPEVGQRQARRQRGAQKGRASPPGGDAFRRPAGCSNRDAWDRAVAYVARCQPAVDGRGGSATTMGVARAVVWGFALGADAGYELLAAHYNPRCVGPWSEAELRHKCDDAERTPDPEGRPRGYLLERGRSGETETGQSCPVRVSLSSSSSGGCGGAEAQKTNSDIPSVDVHALLGLPSPPPGRACPIGGKPVLRHRESRRKSMAASMPCRRWRCVVCCRRIAWARGEHYARCLLAHPSPLAYFSTTAAAWAAVSRALNREKASYLRVEWARRPGEFIVWATARPPGLEAEMLPPDRCVCLLGHTLLVVCEQVEADASGEQAMRTAAAKGKRARLLTSSKNWAPPKKAPTGDWERVGVVRSASCAPVELCLRRHGVSRVATRQGMFADDGSLNDAEWVVSWEWPCGWTDDQVKAVLDELAELRSPDGSDWVVIEDGGVAGPFAGRAVG